MNQILYELSSLCRWFSAGAMNTYDSEFATDIGGYPAGSFVLGDDLKTVYRCTTNGNTANPNSVTTGWVKVAKDIADILSLGTAAYKDVGTGTNQIPDMASFTAGPGWMKFPSGKIIQYGYHTSSNSGAVIINFPIPFPTQCYGVTGGGTDSNAANIAGCQVIDNHGFYLSAWLVGSGIFNRTATNISWISVGI
ncbi:hypothetical protein N4C39_002998 [Salmonella enterica]|nr:hypothetical protein [Salmonella enterica]